MERVSGIRFRTRNTFSEAVLDTDDHDRKASPQIWSASAEEQPVEDWADKELEKKQESARKLKAVSEEFNENQSPNAQAAIPQPMSGHQTPDDDQNLAVGQDHTEKHRSAAKWGDDARAQHEINNASFEVKEDEDDQAAKITPPASLTSRQQELPLNMAPPAQRPRDMHPTLRVDSTAGNCIRVTWTVAANKLRTKNKAFTSPNFELWQKGACVLILSSYPHSMEGGFQTSKGVGRVELKFCGETEFARKVHYQVAIGRNKEFTAWIMTFARGLRVLCSTSGISRMRSTRGLSSCTLKPAWKVTSMKVTSELPMLLSLLADPLLSMEEQHPCGVKALW